MRAMRSTHRLERRLSFDPEEAGRGAGLHVETNQGELGLGADLDQGEVKQVTKQRIERAALRLGAGRRRRPSAALAMFRARDG